MFEEPDTAPYREVPSDANADTTAKGPSRSATDEVVTSASLLPTMRIPTEEDTLLRMDSLYPDSPL